MTAVGCVLHTVVCVRGAGHTCHKVPVTVLLPARPWGEGAGSTDTHGAQSCPYFAASSRPWEKPRLLAGLLGVATRLICAASLSHAGSFSVSSKHSSPDIHRKQTRPCRQRAGRSQPGSPASEV